MQSGHGLVFTSTMNVQHSVRQQDLQLSETPVLSDTTIRAAGFEGFCVHKRWADYQSEVRYNTYTVHRFKGYMYMYLYFPAEKKYMCQL